MKKEFLEPEVEMIRLNVEDVITTSGENWLPLGPED